MTTAATLWLASVLGLCFGGAPYGLRLVGLAPGLVILWVLKKLESCIPQEQRGYLSMIVRCGKPTDEEVRTLIETTGAWAKSWRVA